jgi:heme O synthase-like polyprenyltransferase
MGVGGAGMLWLCCNPATAALGAGTILLYCGAYTPLKRVTRFNTEVGAVVGAIPPVMGWTAAFGGAGLVSVEACLLAGTLFAWQMHHFMTIAWRQRADYATAGYVMMSLNDPTGLRTAKKGLAWCALMAMLPFVTCLYGITLPMFMVTGGAVNAAMFVSFYRFYQDRTNHNAYKAQIAGFLQLVAFLVLMVFHLKERNNITAFQQLMYLSSVGNDYCVHRYAEGKDHLCVVVFGKKTGESLSDTMDEVEQSVKSVEGLNKGPAIAMDGSHES